MKKTVNPSFQPCNFSDFNIISQIIPDLMTVKLHFMNKSKFVNVY